MMMGGHPEFLPLAPCWAVAVNKQPMSLPTILPHGPERLMRGSRQTMGIVLRTGKGGAT